MFYSIIIKLPKSKVKQFSSEIEQQKSLTFEDPNLFRSFLDRFANVIELSKNVDTTIVPNFTYESDITQFQKSSTKWKPYNYLDDELKLIFQNKFWSESNAIKYEDLPPEQKSLFVNSFGVRDRISLNNFKIEIRQAFEKLGFSIPGRQDKNPIITFYGKQVLLPENHARIGGVKYPRAFLPDTEIFRNFIKAHAIQKKTDVNFIYPGTQNIYNSLPAQKMMLYDIENGKIIANKKRYFESDGVLYYLPDWRLLPTELRNIIAEEFGEIVSCSNNIKKIDLFDTSLLNKKIIEDFFAYVDENTGYHGVGQDQLEILRKNSEISKKCLIETSLKYYISLNGVNYFIPSEREYASFPRSENMNLLDPYRKINSRADQIFKTMAAVNNELPEKKYILSPQHRLNLLPEYNDFLIKFDFENTTKYQALLKLIKINNNENNFKLIDSIKYGSDFFINKDLIDQQNFSLNINDENQICLNVVYSKKIGEMNYPKTAILNDMISKINAKTYTSDLVVFAEDRQIILFIIEFDGIDHFESRGNNTDTKFIGKFISDQIKNLFCKKYNIQLLRIPNLSDFKIIKEQEFQTMIENAINKAITQHNSIKQINPIETSKKIANINYNNSKHIKGSS